VLDSTAISLRHFEAFVAVAETGSFSRAAERMRLAQPTVSGHVASLERLFGLRLFDREPTVQATPAGRALLQRAREALAARERGIVEALAAAGTVAGDLDLAGSNVPSTYLLPPILAGFLASHPGVRVRLWSGDSGEAIERVATGAAEVGAVGRRPDDDGLAAVPFDEDRVVLLAPASHPLASHGTLKASDLKGAAFVLREAGSGTGRAAENALRKLDLEFGRDLHACCEVASGEAVREAVAAGIGLAFVSDRAVGKAAEAFLAAAKGRRERP
jgi:LysR family transcriptional regulator, low CO2-responsive transcriptional regulator